MRAGDLRNRITIQRQTQAQDEVGQPLDVWVDIAAVWADVRNMTGLGAVKADARVSEVKTAIRIRWRTDIKAGMRVLHGDTVYQIDAVLPDPAKREHVDLVCKVVA